MNYEEIKSIIEKQLQKERGGRFDISGEAAFSFFKIYGPKAAFRLKIALPPEEMHFSKNDFGGLKNMKAVLNLKSAGVFGILNNFDSYIFFDGEKAYIQKNYYTSVMGFNKNYYTERYAVSLPQLFGKDCLNHMLFIIPFYGIAESEAKKNLKELTGAAPIDEKIKNLIAVRKDNKDGIADVSADFKLNNYQGGAFGGLSPVVLSSQKTKQADIIFNIEDMRGMFLNNVLWGDDYKVTAKTKL